MSKGKVEALDYINFLVGSPKVYTCTEASRVQPVRKDMASHDAFTRLLTRLEPTAEELWKESEAYINKSDGILVIDDTTLDKPYSKKIELVSYHWSGKHHRVVKGINLLTMVWTNGDVVIPTDYRVYDKEEKLTKNDQFLSMLEKAKERGFNPKCVGFDSWYARIDNLKYIQKLGWKWLTRLKSNRLVNPDNTHNRAISEVEIDEDGSVLHLKGYGMIKVFKIVSRKGDIEYWATNDLNMKILECIAIGESTWGIESYHRGIKQYCGIEHCQSRSSTAQKNHILLSIRAFIRLSTHAYRSGMSWFQIKYEIIRSAVRQYLQKPYLQLKTSTA